MTLKPNLKKFIRSTQVFFPNLVDSKFALQNWVDRKTGRVFQRDLNGLRHFDLRGKLILDIGAHRGQSITAFKNAAPGCRIISFEPNTLLADRLIVRHGFDEAVHVEACALSDRSGSLHLYTPFYGRFLFDGLASIHESEAKEWFNRERFYWFDPAKVSIQVMTVPTRTLDSFEYETALLKLSAQRAELRILKGATNTIASNQPIIITAWAWDDEINFLRALGYRQFVYRGGRFRTRSVETGYFSWFLLPKHEVELQQRGQLPFSGTV